MKSFSMKRDESRSVLHELRGNGMAQHDFLPLYTAREVHPKAVAMNVTKSHSLQQEFWLYRDKEGAFLNKKYFSEMQSVSVAKLMPGSSFILGKVHKDLDWEMLIRFLIDSDIICTYVHMESTMTVTLTSSSRAEVRGKHIYFTNTENEDPFAFAVEQDHTQTLHCFGI